MNENMNQTTPSNAWGFLHPSTPARNGVHTVIVNPSYGHMETLETLDLMGLIKITESGQNALADRYGRVEVSYVIL